ncbi:MAG: UDP-N-acetylmuramoyl-tripeptide--D-alanyl-D-alanine ligase [Proteobacteria bacterium]|nr:UDP-N-acetylmuramoyl-tripeptide--D-alanyl-D-alanine ligase [Pseudomonadota bacterium]
MLAENQDQILWNSADLASALGQKVVDGISASSVSIDTRTIRPGALFIGIVGETMDGGKFAATAFEQGAAACILQSREQIPLQEEQRCIIVPDTMQAMEQLAVYARSRFTGQLIGVTGSVGKTSTKELLRLVLDAQGHTYANYGTFNNHYGVPLSLANLPPDAEYAILEMGMNHAGELQALSKLARPHVAIVTAVAPAHLEFFSSVAAIAAAKAEIFEGLEPSGKAIIDFDNPYHQILLRSASAHGAQIIGFSQYNKSNFMLLDTKIEDGGTLVTITCNEKLYSYKLQVMGEHWVKLSMAVLATVWALEADLEAAMYQMQNFQPPSGRGLLKKAKNGAAVIDDSYNANPASVTASLASLAMHKKPGGRAIAILGDMRELGKQGTQLHADLAEPIRQHKIDLVYTVGELMHSLHEALPDDVRAGHSENAAELAAIIVPLINSTDVISIKGSKSMNMSLIVNALVGL